MRRTIIATKQGRAAAVSGYPLEPHERGVTPAWKVDGHPGIAKGYHLHNDIEVPYNGVRVRLPRRLCARTVDEYDVLRWIRGQVPGGVAASARRALGVGPAICDSFRAPPGDPSLTQIWEREYPRRGLGLPKRLPRSRRPGYAPVLNIHASGDILLDDQHVTTARHVEAEFHREVIHEDSVHMFHQTMRPGEITAKVTIELETSAASYEAVRAVAYARHNGSPNLRATVKGGAGYAGTITRYTYEPGPRFATVTLDLVMVTITTSTIQTG